MDGLLLEETARAMQEHVNDCPSCATRDVWMRRSLLALQALPRIEPSAGFRERLFSRLAIPPFTPISTRGVERLSLGIAAPPVVPGP